MPLVWLNLLCLDAPLVALSWLWLFARSLGIPIARGGAAALFLTAWFIYLADRFTDNLSLGRSAPVSLRQDFCRRHRLGWLSAILLVGGADAFVIVRLLEPETRLAGASIGVCAFLYFLVNQFAPSVWRRLPLKEISIGFLFAAGTLTPIALGLTSAIVLPFFCFAILCAMNCISIAVWERDLDLAQARISIATVLPKIGRVIFPVLILLVAAACALPLMKLKVCLSASALLLGVVHFFRNRIPPDPRTALADLVLLVPLFVLSR